MKNKMTEKHEKNRNDWNLAVDRLKKISEITSKAESMHYRTLKHRDEKHLKAWANLIKVLSHNLDNYLIKRDHSWERYSSSLDQIQQEYKSYDDLLKSLEEVRKNSKTNTEKAIEKMTEIDKLVNYCRIKEGFDLPTQVEKIDPNTVASDKMN